MPPAETVEIRWGKYRDFEGPWTPGKHPFVLPPNPSFAQKVVSVITATEGGKYDAVNAYDVCKMSVGLLQWCDLYFLTTNMLGMIAERYGSNAIFPVVTWAQNCGYTFHKIRPGTWRFALGGKDVVDTAEKLQAMYFGSASGKIGSFSTADAERAKNWVIAMGSIWNDERTRSVQDDYTLAMLNSGSFLFSDVRDFLFAKEPPAPLRSLSEAELFVAQAAYYSFAANNPTVARKQFQKWRSSLGDKSALDIGDVHDLLRTLTFGPNIAIYPGRYGKIRVQLEKLSGLDLPDTAKELAELEATIGDLSTTEGLQQKLIDLGYEVGPKDGIFGRKTKAAIIDFQTKHGLTPDGIVGPKTLSELQKAA